MNKIAIIYHSETGNTLAMAELIAQGAQKGDCETRVMPVDKLDTAFIKEARAVLFGTPTYYGTVSWQMKKLMDTIPVNLTGKLGAPFASAAWRGGGGYEFAEFTLIAGMLIRGMLIVGLLVSALEPGDAGMKSNWPARRHRRATKFR